MALVKPKTNDAPKAEDKKDQAAQAPEVSEAKSKETHLAEPKQDQPIVPAEEVNQALVEAHPVGTTNVAAFIQRQAEEGFEGAMLDGFSFPRIKLDDGKFLMGTEEEEIGESFKFRAMKSRPIYVIRQSEDGDAESFYSYDPNGATNTDGSSAKAKLTEWLEQGYGDEDHPLSIREYLEMFALMVDGEHDGEMVSLSIPPSSKTRFWGKAAEAEMHFHLGTGQVIFGAKVGKKAGEGAKSFRPWNFSIEGPAEG